MALHGQQLVFDHGELFKLALEFGNLIRLRLGRLLIDLPELVKNILQWQRGTEAK
jgi:hypothetical protein